jgi:hypothetical protein
MYSYLIDSARISVQKQSMYSESVACRLSRCRGSYFTQGPSQIHYDNHPNDNVSATDSLNSTDSVKIFLIGGVVEIRHHRQLFVLTRQALQITILTDIRASEWINSTSVAVDYSLTRTLAW